MILFGSCDGQRRSELNKAEEDAEQKTVHNLIG